ncbi:hypothetical protein [Kitasatospora sp. NPDC050463]|uniref:hypothetical protein n=1 Tax=Kitasatospora sp. NPDC050463 TaxID=3155786 RepID=UPI0033DBCF96
MTTGTRASPTRTKRLSVIEVTRDREGVWAYADLNRVLGETPGLERPVPYAAADSGLAALGSGPDGQRLYYVDTFGSVVELVHDGRWLDVRRLTTDFGAPAAGSGRLAATSAGHPAVHYLDAHGRIVRLQWDGDDSGRWSFRIAQDAPAGSSATPISALSTDADQYAYYLSGRHVIEVRWDTELNQTFRDLTSRTRGADEPNTAPYSLSSLATEELGSGARRVYYPSLTGHLIEIALDGRGDMRGDAFDLTVTSGAPRTATPTPMAAFAVENTRPENTLSRVFYLDEFHGLSTMGREGNGWAPKVLEHVPPAARNTSVAGASDPYSALEYVPFVDAFGHLLTLIRTGNSWDWVDLSGELDLPRPARQSPLAAVVTDDGAHVYYLTDEPPV